MNVRDQHLEAAAIFHDALRLLQTKGTDYAPDDLAFKEVVQQAADTGVSVELVLWILMQKHLTALRSYVMHGHLADETVRSRCVDIANFAALIATFVSHRGTILSDIYTWARTQPCESTETIPCTSHALVARCPRCRLLGWLEQPITASDRGVVR